MWHQPSGALLFKGEDKSSEWALPVAVADLGRKMCSSWNPLVMGSLPFLMCYASCSPYLQFFVIMRNSNLPVAVSDILNLGQVNFAVIYFMNSLGDMYGLCTYDHCCPLHYISLNQAEDRIQTLVIVTNVLRLMRLLTREHLVDIGWPVLSLGKPVSRAYGVRILVACDPLHGYYVVKTVTALSSRENITLDFDSIVEVVVGVPNGHLGSEINLQGPGTTAILD